MEIHGKGREVCKSIYEFRCFWMFWEGFAAFEFGTCMARPRLQPVPGVRSRCNAFNSCIIWYFEEVVVQEYSAMMLQNLYNY